METDPVVFLIVCPLVFLGSVIDAVAGGGGLITLPAYLMAGVPAHLALGTSKLSSTMGMAASAWRLYRGGFTDLRLSVAPVAAAFAGSFLGARLALLVPEGVFELLLVGMLPFAAVFVLGKKTFPENPEPIARALATKLHHGVTEVRALGMYSRKEKFLLVCVINKRELSEFENLIRKFPNVFVSVSSVNQIFGRFYGKQDNRPENFPDNGIPLTYATTGSVVSEPFEDGQEPAETNPEGENAEA